MWSVKASCNRVVVDSAKLSQGQGQRPRTPSVSGPGQVTTSASGQLCMIMHMRMTAGATGEVGVEGEEEEKDEGGCGVEEVVCLEEDAQGGEGEREVGFQTSTSPLDAMLLSHEARYERSKPSYLCAVVPDFYRRYSNPFAHNCWLCLRLSPDSRGS